MTNSTALRDLAQAVVDRKASSHYIEAAEVLVCLDAQQREIKALRRAAGNVIADLEGRGELPGELRLTALRIALDSPPHSTEVAT